jgi:hypothetical protein
LTQYLSPTTVFFIKKVMEIKMSAHVVELKNDGSMLFWYSQSISPAREIQTSSSGPKKPAG